MSKDALADLGYLFLGSRMKRLAERMQADAHRIFKAHGHADLQPAFYAILATLDMEDGLSVGDLVERLGISQPAVTRSVSGLKDHGLIDLRSSEADQRVRHVWLTADGQALIADLKVTAWRDIRAAAKDICKGVSGDVLEVLSVLESRQTETPLEKRCRPPAGLSVIEYDPALAPDFYRINREWIEDMFTMEATDEKVLSDPDTHIISKGGTILFVHSETNGLVGTGALMPAGETGSFELTKMGVLATSRGEKAGEFLLAALLRKARDIGARELFLLTNAKCEAAIHLYEKLGFRHDDDIMQRFGARYQRCDVAMSYPLPR